MNILLRSHGVLYIRILYTICTWLNAEAFIILVQKIDAGTIQA